MEELMIKINNVSKMYKLGQIGGTTLRDELQRRKAKRRGEEDPTKKIGSKNYDRGETFMALDGVSFEVKKGERVGIIGHNGAGKSTLLKLISRVTAPTSGEIGLNGRVASMLEVGTGFHGELTGRENIYMNGAILGMTKKEIDAKMEDIIEFSECRQFIDTPVKRYSSGMYVKLAFSVAAHLDSEIMIMDEVLAVGDMAFQKKCLDKMNEVSRNQDRTILYVSHNMNTIRELCSRVIVLNHGKIIFDGNVEDGIEKYSGNNTNVQNNIVFTEKYHQRKDVDSGFQIKELMITSLQNSNIPNSKISFSIKCLSQKDLKKVYFRFETKFQDGSKVGTMISNAGVDYYSNKLIAMEVVIDTSHMMPGGYSSDIIAFQIDDRGNEVFLDGVYPGVFFEVKDIVSNENKLVWLHRYWGHIRLHDVKIIKNFISE